MSFSREGLALIKADKPQFSELSMGLISAPMLNSERQAALRGQVGVYVYIYVYIHFSEELESTVNKSN